MDNIQQTIRKCLKGNRAAQKALYKQYMNAWKMTSIRYGNSREESEDILQEGVLQIFKDLHQYNHEKSNFKTWSQRVIVHAALRFLKKSNWQKMFVDIDSLHSELQINNRLISDLSANEILGYISKLPQGYKLVFNMFAIESYTHKEIAEKLNITIGTSKSQLFKARRMLQEIIEKSYINE